VIGRCIYYRKQPVRIYGTYHDHWIAGRSGDYWLLPMNVEYERLKDADRFSSGGSLIWNDYDFTDMPATGQLDGPQSVHCYIEQWTANEQVMKARASIRGTIKTLSCDGVRLLADREYLDSFYLQPYAKLAESMPALYLALLVAEERKAKYDNLMTRAAGARFPNMMDFHNQLATER
jgi:hypothetical protein